MLKWVVLVTLLATIWILSACASGSCPAGTREYAGDCIPIDSSDASSNPDDSDGDSGNPEPTIPDPPQQAPSEPNQPYLDDFEDMEIDDAAVFEVGEDDHGVIAWIEGNSDNYIYPFRLIDPNGQVVYSIDQDGQDGVLFNDQIFHWYSDSSLSIFLNNSPKMPFSPGEWVVEIASYNAGNNLSFNLITKPKRDDDATGLSIDVNIWFVGVQGVNANSANNHKVFQECITVFKKLYKTANIKIGTINYRDASANSVQKYGVIDSYAEYRDLLEISVASENNNPNLFLINSFGGDFYGVLGMAGHIPGPAGKQGTPFSGVAVAMTGYEYYPRIMGLTMAHELGHWLGLFHPSEFSGDMFDPLNDTPECSSAYDGNGDGAVDWDECQDNGAENVMFWMVPFYEDFTIENGPISGVHFSQDQHFVFDHNPIVHYASD